MSLRLTRDLFNSAEVVQGSGQIKNTLQITVNTDGSVTDTSGDILDILPYGNRGDHCVTKLEFTLPEALQEGYECFIVADLKEGLYVQHCSMENLKAIAWITTSMSFSETDLVNTLFACVESEALQTGNLDGEIEIFVTDEFSGQVKSNFLTSGWHTGTVDDEYIMTGEDTVVDNHVPETPNPESYTPMTWVNGETELNAANMNNIMLGIGEALAWYTEEQTISGQKTFEDTVRVDRGDGVIEIGVYDDGDAFAVKTPSLIVNVISSFSFPASIEVYDPISMNDNRISGLRAPLNDSDAATKEYVDDKTVDLGNALFTPDSNFTVNMQHSYKIGDLVFVHINLHRNSAVSSTGIYTIGSLSKKAQHQHLFIGVCYNGSAANSDAAILETNGNLKLRLTSTTSASTYNWDLSFFFAENN